MDNQIEKCIKLQSGDLSYDDVAEAKTILQGMVEPTRRVYSDLKNFTDFPVGYDVTVYFCNWLLGSY